ncbi:MAG: DUF1549 and DUF1553 domain-containing protein, partial [Planctomycetota bacterium]
AECHAQSGGNQKKSRLPASVMQAPRSSGQVRPVIAGRRDACQQQANRIDDLVERKLFQMEIAPNAMSSDAVFLRRVYLDVAGRIPTYQEAKTFLDSKSDDKRKDLIDRLLSSEDYVSHFYNFWADTLRVVERPQPNIVATPYAAYIKDVLRSNKPYNTWVYEMLTADGKVWENPAVGFQLRDDGMPLPYVDNTVRVFLGTQIGCAQCHDHPFDDWSQLQFYQLAAFTSGTRTRNNPRPKGMKKGNAANTLISEARKRYDKGRVPGSFQRMVRANTYSVSESKRPLRLPHDYAYDDAKPKSVVEPEVLWGSVPKSAAKGSGREQLAAWMTSPANEAFSQTISNRLWAKMLGVGIVEPIDDFNPDNPRTNQELLTFLSREIIRLNFDMKEFVRMILYSKTYQRTSSDYLITSGEPYYFPGPVLRRMTAEQAWDSMLTLAVRNTTPFERPTANQIGRVINLNLETASVDEVQQKFKSFEQSYSLGKYKRDLKKHAYRGVILCRASELPTPLEPSHFLRQFGQGDRETINGGQEGATVPQILAMFNGPITHVMLERGSYMYDTVMQSEDTDDAVERIFISVLTRRPSPNDRKNARKEFVGADRRNMGVGVGNVVWALLNTREFMFVQ